MSSQPLIGGRQQQQNQVVDLIQLMKNNNNQLQYLINGEQDENDISEIKQFKVQMPKDIQKLRELMNNLEKNSKNTIVRQKMRQIKNEANKEIDKFGQLMRYIINTSFNFQLSLVDKEGLNDSDLKQLQESFSRPRVINFDSSEIKQSSTLKQNVKQQNGDQNQSKQQGNENKSNNQKTLNFETVKVENPIDEEQGLQLRTMIQRKHRNEADLEASILNEKQRQIDKLEKDLVKMNEIMKDIDEMVQDGQEDLNFIVKNVKIGEKDAVKANEELEEAAKTQKGNTKLYVAIAIFVVVFVVVLMLILFLTGSI